MTVGYTEKKVTEDSQLADNITQPTSEQATPVKGHQGTGQHFRNVIERTILGTINAGLHLAEPAIVAAIKLMPHAPCYAFSAPASSECLCACYMYLTYVSILRTGFISHDRNGVCSGRSLSADQAQQLHEPSWCASHAQIFHVHI